MHKMIAMCLWLLFVTAVPASGEYYQYHDAQGNLRFTDDIANIPESERTDMTAFESVKSDGFSASEEESPPARVSPKPLKKDDPSDATREELEVMRTELDRTAASINVRRNELEAQRPADDAPDAERKAYFDKVTALNADLRAYKQRRREYNEKVKAFNAGIALKDENAPDQDDN